LQLQGIYLLQLDYTQALLNTDPKQIEIFYFETLYLLLSQRPTMFYTA